MKRIDQPGTLDALDSLSGSDKVAALMLALGKPNATKVLKLFDPEELQILARSIAGLRPVPAADLERLVEEFASSFSDGGGFAGNIQDMESLLSDVMTEDQIAQAMSDGTEAPVADEPVWPKLAGVKQDVLAAYLLLEHPQTAAFILSKAGSDVAAEIIERFPDDLRSKVVSRMLVVGNVAQAADRAVQIALRADLLASPDSRRNEIADILNKLGKSDTDSLLMALEQSRPADAKALKNMLFSFEDVVSLRTEDRAKLFDSVPMERLLLALSGTDAEFQGVVLSSLGARARRMAEAELQGGGQAQPADVNQARREIVGSVLTMIAAGDITRVPEGGQEGAAG